MGKKNKKKGASLISFNVETKLATDQITKELLDVCLKDDLSTTKYIPYFEELYKLVQNLLNIQKEWSLCKSCPTTAEERNSNLSNLVSHLKKSDVCVDSYSVKLFDNEGFGLAANQEIEEHEELIRIPFSEILSTHGAVNNIGNFLHSDPMCSTMPNIALSLYLLYELSLGESSNHHFYINSLPAVYENVLYLTPEDVALLKGSSNLELIVKTYRNICRQYAYLYKQMSLNSLANCFKFRHAFCFDDYSDVELHNQTKINSKVDLFEFRHLTTDFDVSTKSLVFYTMETCCQGDQIYMFYGRRTNAEFFTYNGFVIHDNSFDSLSINLGFSIHDPLFAKKVQLAKRVGLSNTNSFHIIVTDPLPINLIGFVRIFLMLQDQVDELNALSLDEDVCQKVFNTSLDVETDKSVIAYLRTRLQLLLKSYVSHPTKELLPSQRRCIQLIESEKQLLQMGLNALQSLVCDTNGHLYTNGIH